MWVAAASAFFDKLPSLLKKWWAWVKVHGDIVLIACISIFILIATRKSTDMIKVIKEKKENYKAQVNAIEQSHKAEIEKRDKALERYDSAIADATKKYAESERELDKEKKARAKEIIEAHSDNPDAITQELSKLLGVDIYVK
jgi:uncharacterized membrane protein YhiD involved in acid resistance